jgi:hypothetical protein
MADSLDAVPPGPGMGTKSPLFSKKADEKCSGRLRVLMTQAV